MKKLIVLCLLCTTHYLFAAPAATVLFTSGKVSGSGGSAIARGASLSAGDSVITGDASAANIKYTNGTLVNLGANTNYKILEYSPKQGETQIKSELNQGDMNSKTNGKTKESVKTPVVALAVLGTKFELAVHCNKKFGFLRKKKCTDQVNVHVIEGRVNVGGQTINAGQSVVATSASGVKPAPFPPSSQVNSPAGAPGSTDISSSSSTSTVSPTSYTTTVTLTTSQTTNNTTTTVTPGTTTTSAPIPIPPPPCPPNCGPLLPMTITPMVH